MKRNVIRPVTLSIQEVDANGKDKPKQSVFEIHLGQPGEPRVYRRRAGQLRRVKDEDTLWMVAKAFRRSTDASKNTDELMNKRRAKWWYKMFEWFYDLPRRIMDSLADAVGPDWRTWFR